MPSKKLPESKPGWEWVDHDMEYEAIVALVDQSGGVEYLLGLGDVYSIVRDELSNEALEKLAEDRGHCTQCGAKLFEAPDDDKHCPNCEPEAWTDAPDDEEEE